MAMAVRRLNDGSETWETGEICTAAEINYLVTSPDNKAAAIQAVLDAAPDTYGGLPKKHARFTGYTGDGCIELAVVYEKPDAGDDDGYDEETPTMSFDCGGGTKHVVHSLNQTRQYGNKDAGGLIGWNGKSGDACQIAGVDVPTAQLRETYTRVVQRTSLTTNYKRSVAGLVGKVNSSSFKGWDAGEVMFLGMSYSAPTKGKSKVVVTYNFAIQPNETNVKVGDQTVSSKKGWEYIWSLSKTEIQAATGFPKVVVEAIFVDQVCEYKSFGDLGLGS